MRKRILTSEIESNIINGFKMGLDYSKLSEINKISEGTVYRFLKSKSLKSKDRKKPHKCNFDDSEIGKKYNWLTIFDKEYSSMFKTWVAKCKCDCGMETTSTIRNLKSGAKKTCGQAQCRYHHDLSVKNGRTTTTGHKEISGSRWASWRIGAEKRKLDFKVSVQYAWKLFLKQDKKCALSGLPITFEKGNQSASLDRIDSSKGYTPSNIQWVHKNINRMKWDMDETDFIKCCNVVSNYNK